MTRDLQWGTSHRLVIADDMGPRLTAVLKLEKPGGKQDILIELPAKITLAMVLEEWAAQGGKWEQLFLCERPAYVALRAIRLTDDLVLLWTVMHVNDAPHDTCAVAPLRRDEWPKPIVAVATSQAG